MPEAHLFEMSDVQIQAKDESTVRGEKLFRPFLEHDLILL